MSRRLDAAFLDRALIDSLHRFALQTSGGAGGVRDSHVIDSAIGRAMSYADYLVGCDLYDIAATYAHGIAQNQGYIDGNKRTGLSAALVFLEANGVKTSLANEEALYDMMIGAANRTVNRDDIAQILRTQLSRVGLDRV